MTGATRANAFHCRSREMAQQIELGLTLATRRHSVPTFGTRAAETLVSKARYCHRQANRRLTEIELDGRGLHSLRGSLYMP